MTTQFTNQQKQYAMATMALAAAFDKNKYPLNQRIRFAKKLIASVKKMNYKNFDKLPQHVQALGAVIIKGAGGGYPAGEVGQDHATYPEFDNTVQKSYVSDPALKTQDKENHPVSEYDYNLCVQKQRENGITDMDYIDNICKNEEPGAPKDYDQNVKYGKRKTKQASMTIPYYVNLITDKGVYPEQPKHQSIKNASLEGAKAFNTYMTLHYRNSLPLSGTSIKSAKKEYTKKDDRPYHLQLSERLH